MTIYSSDGEVYDTPLHHELEMPQSMLQPKEEGPVTPQSRIDSAFHALKYGGQETPITIDKGDWESQVMTDFPTDEFANKAKGLVPFTMKEYKTDVEKSRSLQDRLDKMRKVVPGIFPYKNEGVPVVPGEPAWTPSHDLGQPVVYAENARNPITGRRDISPGRIEGEGGGGAFEIVDRAAIKSKGKVITGSKGSSHFSDDLMEQLPKGWEKDYQEGFITNTGRFINREEAARLSNISRPSGAISEDFKDIMKNRKELK